MTLKSIYHFATLVCGLAAAVAFFAGCDNIDEDERFVGPLPFEIRKNVLVEDFTGQLCLNCPLASETVHGLQETYGADHVIAVAMHGGALSLSEAQGGLATQQGNDYVAHWGVEAFPQGMVDRHGGLLDFQTWGGKVFERLQLPAAVGILLNHTYDAATRTLSIQTSLTATQAISGAHLQLWLTEDNVTALQRTPDGKVNREYLHQHVFRTAVNGTWGEEISIEEESQQSYASTVTLKEGWKPENMHIVAFVYDASGVLQAERQAVANKAEAAE